MPLRDEVEAVRSGVALHDGSRFAWLRVSGEGAFALVDKVSAQALRLQHAQLRQSLFLGDDGAVKADVLVARDEADYLVGVDGLTAAEAKAWLERHRPAQPVEVTDVGAARASLTLCGPWAWELLGDALSPDLVGMPYLSFFRLGPRDGLPEVLCIRAGTTGEFGYELLVDRAHLPALRERVVAAGRRFGLAEVSAEALALCSLENGFFDIRREGRFGLDPVELQLQWRLGKGRDFVGAAALEARKARGVTRRVTAFTCARPVAAGDAVEAFGRPIGKVLACDASLLRGDAVGVALLELPWAHPGVEAYAARHGDGLVPLRTAAPPHLNNRSLYVSPLHHSWAAREGEDFPPVVA